MDNKEDLLAKLKESIATLSDSDIKIVNDFISELQTKKS